MSTTLTPDNAAEILGRKRPVYGAMAGVAKPHSIAESKAGVKIGLYGPGGIGKTTLAGTICDTELGRPALYLNARGNPEVIRSRGNDIDVIDIERFNQIEAIRKDLVADRNTPYKSVILDNISDMWSMDLRDLYGPTTVVDWQKHSASTAHILAMLRTWIDMADGYQHLNLIMVLWETPEKRQIRGEDVTRSEVALNSSLQAQVPGLITWLGRLYITDDVLFTRCLDFRPIETQQQSKFQVDPDDAVTKDIPMEIYNPSLATLVDTVKGGKPWPADRHRAPTLKEISDASVKAQAQR